MRLFTNPLWTKFTAIAWPFFVSELRTKAAVAIGVLVALLLTSSGLNIVNSYVTSDFMTALEQRHEKHFYLFAAYLAGVFAASTLVEVFSHYTEQRIGLLWRERLTKRLLDRYLANRAYHRLTSNEAIDNPDQRISEDIRTFTTTSLSFLVLIINSVITVLAFLSVLWSITPWLVLTAVGYSLAGSLCTILVGKRLVPLNNSQLQKEADFRFGLGRVREHAEAIAQKSGHEGEKSQLLSRLSALLANFRDIINVTRNVGFFTKGYNYLIPVIPVAVVAPLYIGGRVEFGKVAQSAMAFGQVVGAFSLIVTKFQDLSSFAAVVNRLGSMWEATEEVDRDPKESAAERPAAARA